MVIFSDTELKQSLILTWEVENRVGSLQCFVSILLGFVINIEVDSLV